MSAPVFRVSRSNDSNNQSNNQTNNQTKDQSIRFADIHARLSPVRAMPHDPSNDQPVNLSPSIPLDDYSELPPAVKVAMLQMNDQLNSQPFNLSVSQPTNPFAQSQPSNLFAAVPELSNPFAEHQPANPFAEHESPRSASLPDYAELPPAVRQAMQQQQSVNQQDHDYDEMPASVRSALEQPNNQPVSQPISMLDDEYSELPPAVREALIKQSINQSTSPSPDDDEFSELPDSVRQMIIANNQTNDQSNGRSPSPAVMPDYAERPKSLAPSFSIKSSSAEPSLNQSNSEAGTADVDSPRTPSANQSTDQPTTPLSQSNNQANSQSSQLSLSATQPVKPQPPTISGNHSRSQSAIPLNNQSTSNQLGSLHVQVCKATGKAFESGIKTTISLTVGQCSSNQSSNQPVNQAIKQSTNPRKHPLGSKRKPVTWNESFNFAIYHHAETLQVDCHAAASSMTQIHNPSVKPSINQPIGSVSINLSTLPQAKSVKKWYELKRNGESIGVVQLILTHHLIYQMTTAATHRHNQSINQSMNQSIINGSQSGSLTQVPSHQAREAIRKAIIAQSMNQSMRKQYRFIDYFCIIGVENPSINQSNSQSINQPKILSRFPLIDRPDVSLPAEIGMFCFPNGYQLMDRLIEPRCFSFRLSADMDQMMVTCLCFWTEQTIDQSNNQTNNQPSDDFILPASDTPHVFERPSAHAMNPTNSQSVKLYVPRVLMITSRLSYVPQYREILISIYHHFYAPNNLQVIQLPCGVEHSSHGGLTHQLKERSNNLTIHQSCILQCDHQSIRLDCCGRSIEDYLIYLCEEVPLPTPGGQSINLEINCRSVSLSLPASDLDFPSLEFDLVDCLFDCLDFDSILLILRCLLSEFRAIFWSSNASLCHSVSDLLINLLYPFQWSHIYIPLLPDSLIGILDAPVSYVVGIQSFNQPNIQSINDTHNLVMIDIDRGIVDLSIPPPPLPVQSIKVLKNSIRKLIRPKVFKADSINQSQGPNWHTPTQTEVQHAECLHGNRSEFALQEDFALIQKNAQLVNGHSVKPANQSSIDQTIHERNRAIRYEFFHFWSSLIHGYRDHLYFINGSTPTFDVPSFLANQSNDRSNESSAFLSKFVSTQLFRDFLDRHVEMPSYLSDYLTYLSPQPTNQSTEHHTIHQRPARSLVEWSELVHSSHVVQDEDQLVESELVDHSDDENNPTSGRSENAMFSATSPLTSTVRDLDNDDFNQSSNPTTHQTLSRAQSSIRDRSSSQPDAPMNRPAVLSLAPAVAPFLSSQTIVTAMSPQVAQRNLSFNQAIPQAINEAINPAATETDELPNTCPVNQEQYFKPWLFAEPRALQVADTHTVFTPSVSQSISALKNPATLLHMPISLSREQTDDGAIDNNQSDQGLSQSVTFDGDSLSIAIRSPERRPSFAQLHDRDQSINHLDESPFSSPDLSPTPYDPNSLNQTPREPRSRAESLLIRQPNTPSERVQSTNLLSKSELEKKRSPAQQRLGLLLESLMSKHSHNLIDVGELSGVIELLSLREWRDQLVSLIGQQYGLYDQANNSSNNHRFIRADAFSAMLLLFNGALEECQADGDYTSAYILMQLSARIYTHAQSINQCGHDTSATKPMQMSSFQERVYLIQSIKKHRLWSVSALWDLGYVAEVHRIRHGVWPRQSCEQCKLENEQTEKSPDHQSVEDEEEWRRVEASRAAAEREALSESCFEAMVFLVNTMASLDCHRSFIEFFIEQTCSDDENIRDKQAVLIQLAHNSTAAQQALVRPAMQQSINLSNNSHLQPRMSISSLPGHKNLEKYQLAQREFQLEDL